jgi:hypothetical protein
LLEASSFSLLQSRQGSLVASPLFHPITVLKVCDAMWAQRRILHFAVGLAVVLAVTKNLGWINNVPTDMSNVYSLEPHPQTNETWMEGTRHPVVDIISIGSLTRVEYQKAQRETFGRHPSVRHFFSITEMDDVDKECTARLTWRDVQAISGFCGGLRKDIQNKHRFLYDLKVKFAKPEWLQRTKTDPMAWICAQKRPMAGLWKALKAYEAHPSQELPEFLILMDDDTFYNMEGVSQGLLSLQEEVRYNHEDASVVLAGCVIRGRLKRFKWTFPFGGWGTIFSRGSLEALLQPMHCSASTIASLTEVPGSTSIHTRKSSQSASAMLCPGLMKDRLGEYQVYRPGMSLVDVMYAYVMKEPYLNHANWTLGFCLHSDWIWGCELAQVTICIAGANLI